MFSDPIREERAREIGRSLRCIVCQNQSIFDSNAALAKAQAKDFDGALEDWTELAQSSEPGAPWMPLVRRDIVNMARFLDRDVTDYLPDATADEIAKAGGEAPDADGLASRAEAVSQRLASDPKDYKGWIELAQLRASLGKDEEAAAAIADARRHFRAAPFVLARIDEAAQSLGLDILDTQGTISGPSAQDVVAAGSMSEDERADMIEGMVAGLAAKLEDNPDKLEGWMMLVRSYAVLGDQHKARSAYEAASAHFEGNASAIQQLQSGAGTLVNLN